jgi:hypothetical protein
MTALPDNELAWIAREYASGRRQIDIADEIGATSTMICVSIVQFCQRYGYNVKFRLYYDDRRVCACRAVQNYQGEFTRPAGASRLIYDPVLSAARYEHAWLLRAEGYSLRVIGERLDISKERARQMIMRQGHKVTRAIRHASFTIERTI